MTKLEILEELVELGKEKDRLWVELIEDVEKRRG